VVEEEEKLGPAIVVALDAIGEALGSLVRAMRQNGEYLATITDYIERQQWQEKEDTEEEDKDVEMESGDEEVVRGTEGSLESMG